MRNNRNTKYTDFYDLDVELNRIESLITVIYENFFGRSIEKAKEDAYAIIHCEYERYQDLVSICLGLIMDMQETLIIVQQKYEGGDTPDYSDGLKTNTASDGLGGAP